MKQETFAIVNQHMEDARQSIAAARIAVQQAIVTMTDTDGVNLPFVRDIKLTLGQLSERFDLWKTPVPEQEKTRNAASKKHPEWPHWVDFVYGALRETFDEVREPEKNALVIPLVSYAAEHEISVITLRNAIAELQEQERLSARRLNYPVNYPESWEIVFTRE